MCYLDCTVGLPILTTYALAKRKPRTPRRLFEKRGEYMERLMDAYHKARQFRDDRVQAAELPGIGQGKGS